MKTKRKSIFLLILLSLMAFNFTNAQNEELFTACAQGDFEAVVKAVEGGADVNGPDAAGNMPLAASFFWPGITHYLLENGADPNGGNYPALVQACNNYSVEVVKMLLDAGADPNKGFVSDPGAGVRALLDAEKAKGKKGNKKLIKEWEKQLEGLQKTEITPMQITLQQTNCVPCLEMLFDYGADTNFKTSKNENLLHIYGFYGMTQDQRRDLFAQSSTGWEKWGMKVPDWLGNLPDDVNGTIEEMVHTLIEAGVDINEKNNDKQTPVEYAKKAGKTEIVQAFASFGADYKEPEPSQFAKATDDISKINVKFDFPTEGRNSNNGGGYSANLDLLEKKPQKVALVSYYVYDPSCSKSSGGQFMGQASINTWRISDAAAKSFANGFYAESKDALIAGFKDYNVDLLTPDQFLDTPEKEAFFQEFEQESGKREKKEVMHWGRMGLMLDMSTIKACPSSEKFRPFFVANENPNSSHAANFLTAGWLGANRKMTSSLGYELVNGLEVDAVLVAYIVVHQKGAYNMDYTVDAVNLYMFGPNPMGEGADDENRGQFYCGTRYMGNYKTFEKKGEGNYDHMDNVMTALAEKMCKWVIIGERN